MSASADFDIALEPVPHGEWETRWNELMADDWLRYKLDRSRRLKEHRQYLNRLVPELEAEESGVVIDLGPGAGELLEIARHGGHNAVGVDAPVGHGGMGDAYLAACRLMWERQNLDVRCVGAQRLFDGEVLAEVVGHVTLVNSRGSLEQIFSRHMDGPALHLHHDCRRLSWRIDAALFRSIDRMAVWAAESLREGGVFLIHANETANSHEIDELLDKTASRNGLRVNIGEPRIHKWTRRGSRSRPGGYVNLQREWSHCRNVAIKDGAEARVRQALTWAGECGLPVDGPLLVIGPQHGFELVEFRRAGIEKIVGLDIVPEFCRDCRDLGFECIEGEAESLSRLVGHGWNVYASHSLEHCYDLRRAVGEIRSVCRDWCYVAVPIEPFGSEDAAHFSQIRSHDRLNRLFHPFSPAKSMLWEVRPPKKHGEYRGLFVRCADGERYQEPRTERTWRAEHVAAGDTDGDSAREVLRRCARENPLDLDAQRRLARFLLEHGPLMEAEAALLRIIRLRPDDPEAHADLGNVYMSLKHYRAAIQSYETSLRLRSDWLPTLKRLASANEILARFGQATGLWRRVFELDGNDGDALAALDRLKRHSEERVFKHIADESSDSGASGDDEIRIAK